MRCLLCAVALLTWLPAPRPVAASGLDPQAFTRRAETRLRPQALDREVLAEAVTRETNLRRSSERESPLAHDARLDRAAAIQADAMAALNAVTHVNPGRPDLATPAERVRSVGLSPAYVAENVATHFAIRYRSGTPLYPRVRDGVREFSTTPGGPPIAPHTYLSFAASLVDQWMGSPGHRRNILSESAARMGAACTARSEPGGMDTLFCAQVFTSER